MIFLCHTENLLLVEYLNLIKHRDPIMLLKKLTIVAAIAIISGCANNSALEANISQLNQKVDSLTDKVNSLSSQTKAVSAEVNELGMAQEKTNQAVKDTNERIDNVVASYKK
jgi:murein lipoprotein|tara:strand:+ start:653 stop:988 length:336 start_codon:yes stop_codon:yes gene_type:complete